MCLEGEREGDIEGERERARHGGPDEVVCEKYIC
jgi:hypothetical protein